MHCARSKTTIIDLLGKGFQPHQQRRRQTVDIMRPGSNNAFCRLRPSRQAQDLSSGNQPSFWVSRLPEVYNAFCCKFILGRLMRRIRVQNVDTRPMLAWENWFDDRLRGMFSQTMTVWSFVLKTMTLVGNLWCSCSSMVSTDHKGISHGSFTQPQLAHKLVTMSAAAFWFSLYHVLKLCLSICA